MDFFQRPDGYLRKDKRCQGQGPTATTRIISDRTSSVIRSVCVCMVSKLKRLIFMPMGFERWCVYKNSKVALVFLLRFVRILLAVIMGMS